VVDSYRKMTL